MEKGGLKVAAGGTVRVRLVIEGLKKGDDVAIDQIEVSAGIQLD